MRLLVVIIFLGILFSLGSALFYLITEKGDSKRTVKALTWRISMSIGLLILLLLAYKFGWIQPHALMPNQS